MGFAAGLTGPNRPIILRTDNSYGKRRTRSSFSIMP